MIYCENICKYNTSLIGNLQLQKKKLLNQGSVGEIRISR